jgi:Rrf2 family protein
MKFSKTTEYAIRVMVFLANHTEQRYSVNELHKALNVPYKYLGRLMHRLSAAGLVEVLQGKQGGYRIIRNLGSIYLHQIIDVVEGLHDYQRCVLGFDECSDENPCSLHGFWMEHRERLKEMIYSTTLAELNKTKNIKF